MKVLLMWPPSLKITNCTNLFSILTKHVSCTVDVTFAVLGVTAKVAWISFSYGQKTCFHCSAQFSCSVSSLFNSLWPHGLQHTRPPCPSPTPGAYSNSCPSNWWCHPTISSPLSSPSPPAFNLSQHQGLFQWVSSSHQVAKVLEIQLQQQSCQRIFRIDFL